MAGEAEHDEPSVYRDAGGWLSARGREQVRELGLHDDRVAGLPEGDPAFQDVFDAWLRRGDLDRRVPGAESGHEVLARVRAALLSLTDEFRREQVLVVNHGGVMAFAVPRLCDNLRDDHVLDHGFVPNAVPLRFTVGDDGWTAGAWPV
ncbi:histidine phosphatase family protein [Phycicoccus jejuensis]|uniref:histidine phosphatase family protein n=1 Tax=Phycicoccus jejuensis TaxID=367299 RepID=UPI00384ABCA1